MSKRVKDATTKRNELKSQITTRMKENDPNSISNRLNNQFQIFQRLKRIKKKLYYSPSRNP